MSERNPESRGTQLRNGLSDIARVFALLFMTTGAYGAATGVFKDYEDRVESTSRNVEVITSAQQQRGEIEKGGLQVVIATALSFAALKLSKPEQDRPQ